MTAPRHVSTCVGEWLDECPFDLPDALMAIREELDMQAPEAAHAAAVLIDAGYVKGGIGR